MSKKFLLINCYSDNNKGDSGIILSTVELLKLQFNDVQIKGVSTYNHSDPCFQTEHNYLKKHIEVLPSVFGELNIGANKSVLAKNVRLVLDIVRLIFFLLIPSLSFTRYLFSKEENKTLKEIIESDYIISKGGSFICNESNVRDKLSLFRFMFIFLVCFKLKKRVVISCQSIGPVYGVLSKHYINMILRKCYKVILREDVCVNEYQYLDLRLPNTIVLNDIAFYLEADYKYKSLVDIHEDFKFNVGITIKDVNPNLRDNYLDMMKESIEILVKKYESFVHIFPHVTIDNDVEVSMEVYGLLDDQTKKSVVVYSKDYNARELKGMYSQMDFFIGTRLHSTIFAMGEIVPAICISYHGTKSLGIFKNYGLEEYAVLYYKSELLIEVIEKLIPNLSTVKECIRLNHNLYKEKQLLVLDEIFN